jgi:hypothetical protein
VLLIQSEGETQFIYKLVTNTGCCNREVTTTSVCVICIGFTCHDFINLYSDNSSEMIF